MVLRTPDSAVFDNYFQHEVVEGGRGGVAFCGELSVNNVHGKRTGPWRFFVVRRSNDGKREVLVDTTDAAVVHASLPAEQFAAAWQEYCVRRTR